MEISDLSLMCHLQSWTKVLGQIYICGAFFHATLVQPFPTPYNVRHVYTLFLQNFNIVLGGGGEATHFETNNNAFLKLRFKNNEK